MIPAMQFLIAFGTVSLTLCLATESASQEAQASQKPAIIQALRDLSHELQRANETYARDSVGSARSLKWLQKAAEDWTPHSADEGREMRESLERMARVLRSAESNAAVVKARVDEIERDLDVKGRACRVAGLIVKSSVKVVTKRKGTTEVQGLEVVYLEKFLAADPNATPRTFRGFSSPAKDQLVPGRYVLWAREPGAGGRSGERKEASVGVVDELVEVLAP